MKPEKIVFVNQSLESSFAILDESDPLKKGLKKAISDVKENCFAGRSVKKELIPKEILRKYNINNLWIYNLPNGWRMLYVLTSSEIRIIAVILNWMDHKDYERLFKF